jgi:two-component system chemotaxis sensor kinase CheA
MKKSVLLQRKYSIIGFAVGLAFPLLGLLFLEILGLPGSSLLIIIGTAPLILAFAGFYTGRSRDLLVEANEELEFAVGQRTSSIRSMLDISGQAVFTFDRQFKILPEHSSFCRDFFGREIAGSDVRSLLFGTDLDRDDFSQGIELLFEGKANADVVFDLFEDELKVGEKLTQVVYRFLPPDRVLVGLTDITESKTLSQQLAQEERGKAMVFTAVSHQNYFRDLLRDAEEVFFQLDSIIASEVQDPRRLQNLQRLLHTFKGNLSFFHFINTHDLVDEMETYIADMLTLEESVDFRGQGLALKRIYFQELRRIVDTLGEDWLKGVDAVQVPRRQFQQLLHYIHEHYAGDQRLYSSLQSFYMVPFRNMFSQYPHMARSLASRLGKKLEDLEIHGGDFLVLPDRYRELTNSAVHIIRNMVDHGIESPWEREEQGKTPEGQIALHISSHENQISMRFSDDGRGIDFRAVARKALSRGLIDDAESVKRGDLIKLLFRSGFSTSESGDSVSGKGVGLSAVKAAVKKLKGTIQVRTQDTKGTVFTIEIPYKEGAE